MKANRRQKTSRKAKAPAPGKVQASGKPQIKRSVQPKHSVQAELRKKAATTATAKTTADTHARTLSKVLTQEQIEAEYIGIFEKKDDFGRVIPDDRKLIREIQIQPGYEGGAGQGDRVVVRLMPTDAGQPPLQRGHDAPAGRVTEVLGAGGDLAIAEKALIRRLGLRQAFSAEQLAEAKRRNKPVDAKAYESRLDLRGMLLVTIDGEDTRDIDDAVSLYREGGVWHLGVHIADVSHYVKEGSLLDQEAFARGTSVYFPDFVLPMLPPDLSNGICSLNEGVERLAMSCLMTLDGEGAVTGYEIRPSVIRVRERLSYPQVQSFLDRRHWSTGEALAGRGGASAGEAAGASAGGTGADEGAEINGRGADADGGADIDKGASINGGASAGEAAGTGAGGAAGKSARRDDPPFFRDEATGPMLIGMAELSVMLRGRRLAKGALDFELPEGKIIPGPDGETMELKRKDRMLSEMIIEELMIAANEAVAAHIRDMGLPFPYRIHEKPGEDKIAYANILLKNFALAIEARQGGTQPYRQLLAKVKGKPEESVVSTLLLRSMDHAYYGVENRGHFGLASDCYCHFTSPIRRYPDLMVHRMLKQAAEKKKMAKPRAEAFRARMEEKCREASLRERIAEDAERKVDNLWKAGYMSRFVGEEFDGVVSGVTDYALFVALENTAEGMLHVSRLDGYYEYREELMALIHTRNNSRYRLGDPVRVKLESVDVGAGFINFCLPEREGI